MDIDRAGSTGYTSRTTITQIECKAQKAMFVDSASEKELRR